MYDKFHYIFFSIWQILNLTLSCIEACHLNQEALYFLHRVLSGNLSFKKNKKQKKVCMSGLYSRKQNRPSNFWIFTDEDDYSNQNLCDSLHTHSIQTTRNHTGNLITILELQNTDFSTDILQDKTTIHSSFITGTH